MAGDVGGAGGELVPWVLSIGGGIVATLLGVVGKLWAERAAERREHRAELDQLRHELAEANEQIVALQRETQGAHLRDLRRLAGLSTSLEPPARADPWPPVVIREAIERGPAPPRKPRQR
jgi:hypothetical protein